MADAHDTHGTQGSEGSPMHSHHEPEEDPLRTPGWMPLLGIALLLVGALSIYLFVSPGVLSPPSATGDGGADTTADAAVVAPNP